MGAWTCGHTYFRLCGVIGTRICGLAGVWLCPHPIRRGLMKIIAIISQKGGAGKTTLAVHLATAAAAAGHRAAIIDLDPQGTAASWGDRREATEPEVISGQAVRLPALVKAAEENGADFLVLDTAPNAD